MYKYHSMYRIFFCDTVVKHLYSLCPLVSTYLQEKNNVIRTKLLYKQVGCKYCRNSNTGI